MKLKKLTFISLLSLSLITLIPNSYAINEGKTMQKKIVQTAGRDNLGEFAPEFAHFNDDILFGENWNNTKLSPKIRSLLTVTALMSQGLTDSALVHHLKFAKENGVTKDEIAAAITHVAFYAGWPKAWATFNLAKSVWDEKVEAKSDKDLYQNTIFFPIGEPNTAYAKYFIGQSYLQPISKEQVPIYNVTFEPNCRNNWHIHHAKQGGGQMLIGVGGRGYYQAEGQDPIEILPGTVINIPAETKHWHGAAPGEWFSHLAIEVPGTETSNEWLEPVTDEEYNKLK